MDAINNPYPTTKEQIIAESAALVTMWAAKEYGYGPLSSILAREVAMTVTRTIAQHGGLSSDEAHLTGVRATIVAIEKA